MTKTQTTTEADDTTEVVLLPHQNVLETINVDLEDAVNQGFRLQVKKCEKNYAEAFEAEDEAKKKKWWDKSKELANVILKWHQDTQLANQAEQNFNQAIEAADKLFDSGDLVGADTAYRTALQLKPADTHAQQRLADIEQKTIDANTAAEKKTKYDNLIAFAGEKRDADQLTEAREAYQQANDLFPDEQLPIDQIALIDEELLKRANAADFVETVDEDGKPKEPTQEQKDRVKAKVQSIVKDVRDIFTQNGKVTHENLVDILPNKTYDATKPELRIGDLEKHGATVVLIKESEGVYKVKDETTPKKGLSTGAKVGIFAAVTVAVAATMYFLFGRKPKQ